MIFVFGNCALDVERRELRRDGVLQHLEPQVFDVLVYLVGNRERVVRRDDLFETVWRDRAVSDAVLSTRIHAARRAIGDVGTEQRLIRTIHGVGLRFIGEVREEPRVSDARPEALSDRPEVIVVPFSQWRPDALNAPLIEAFTEELVAALAHIGWISVYSGPHAGARYLIDGSLRQLHGNLRLMVRLVLTTNGRTVWSARFSGNLSDGFDLQKRVAMDVARQIASQLYSMESLRVSAMSRLRLTTWESIVFALALLNERGKAQIAEARRVLARAVRSDSGSSAAAGLLSFATTLGVHMGWERRQTTLPSASRIASAALLSNPDDAWAHLALGYAKMYEHPDEAIPHLQQAVRFDPRLSMAHYLLALASVYTGQLDQAVPHADLAEKLAPCDLLSQGNCGVYNNVRSTICFASGQFEKGAQFARKSVAENSMLVPAYRGVVMNLALAGKVGESREALARLRGFVPGLSHSLIEQTTGMAWARQADQRAYHEAFSIAGLR